MEKFKGRYRIASTRWAGWDYSSNAAYFVTICTADRVHYFGKIVEGRMVLSALGQVAADCWADIPAHFPFVVLDAFVAMPNHVHGIVVINKPGGADDLAVETQNIGSLQSPSLSPSPRNRFGPQSQNLASIVRGYKIGVTTYARRNHVPFAWHARYHDHVIRNADEHQRISRYIIANPQHWSKDTFYR